MPGWRHLRRAFHHHRGLTLAALGLTAALALLAGCGSGSDSAAGTAGTAASSAAFPVTIDHRYGSTTIISAPERVVSIGFNEQDTILALGVVPVGVREWFGEKPDAVWPWAHDRLGGAHPTVLPSGDLQMEKIAALRPDLIVGTYSGITKEEYARLSAIAPTITQTDEYVDYGTPWQEQTVTIGRALGKEPEATAMVADVEAQIAGLAESVPALKGATAVAAYSNMDGTFGVYTATDPRGRFLTALGTTVPPDVAALGQKEFFADFSGERIAILDADMLLWAGGPESVKGSTIYAGLPVAKEGRDLFLPDDSTLGGALSFQTVLSLPYFVEQMRPRIAALLDGDPATEPEPAT